MRKNHYHRQEVVSTTSSNLSNNSRQAVLTTPCISFFLFSKQKSKVAVGLDPSIVKLDHLTGLPHLAYATWVAAQFGVFFNPFAAS